MRTISEHLYEVKGHAHADSFFNNVPHAVSRQRLSKRETEVLRLIGLGYSIKEISSQLFVSAHTIVTHRNSIKEKYNCRKATQLAVLAERMGLLTNLEFAI